MAKGPFEVRLLRSSVKGRRPDPALMAYGDLAINYHHEDPCLAIKGDDNSLIEFKVGVNLTVSATAPLSPKLNDLWWDSTTGRLQLFHLTPPAAAGAWVETSPPVAPPDATDTIKGVVRLADNASIGAGTVGRVVDAAQLKAATPDATDAVKGLVQLADAGALTAGTTGRVVDAAQLKAAVAAAVPDATTAVKGIVQLADAAAITAGSAGRVVDAAQLKAHTPPDATDAAKGVVQLADAVAITAGSAGRVVDAAQLKAAAPPTATEAVKGLVELATAAETTTGTDATRAVHPAGLKVELDKKVSKAGDTMTGNLTVPSLNGGPLAGTRNVLINGNFNIRQRGTGLTLTAGAEPVYPVDRWYCSCAGASVHTVLVDTGHPFQVATPAGLTALTVGQTIEAANCAHLVGHKATLSGAVTHPTPITYSIYHANAGNSFGTWATPTRTLIKTGAWPASGFVTFDVPSAAANCGLEVVFSIGTQSATGTFGLGWMQLEPGEVATPFENRSQGLERLLCERYYEKSYPDDSPPGAITDDGSHWTATMGDAAGVHLFTVRLRTAKAKAPAVKMFQPRSGAANVASVYAGAVPAGGNAATTVTLITRHSFRCAALTYGANAASALFVHYVADAELR